MAKYSEEKTNSDIRPELLELAMAIVSAYTDDFEKNKNGSKFLDVTGSLGCWGIAHEQ